MKKILLLLMMALGTVGMSLAVTADDVRIYINPGHGGWGPNDRPMATISYPMLSSTGRSKLYCLSPRYQPMKS